MLNDVFSAVERLRARARKALKKGKKSDTPHGAGSVDAIQSRAFEILLLHVFVEL